jgi:hypothetical protein
MGSFLQEEKWVYHLFFEKNMQRGLILKRKGNFMTEAW